MTEKQFLIEQLRQESQAFKQCFTNFSFQAISISVAVLALSFGALSTFDYAVFAPLPAVALLIGVMRIGIFKYSSANRHAGYELHLARIQLKEFRRESWDPGWDKLTWEEAMRAWRIVQPTLFAAIYTIPSDSWLARWSTNLATVNPFRRRHYRLRKPIRRFVRAYSLRERDFAFEKDDYPWFLPPRLLDRAGRITSIDREARPTYYAGTYLKHMIDVLTWTQLLMLTPLALTLLAPGQYTTAIPPGIKITVLALVLVLIIWRWLRVGRRRQIIEEELLSIHSCAIVWHAVAVAHYRALENLAKRKRGLGRVDAFGQPEHYTNALAHEALLIAGRPLNVHAYIHCKRKRGIESFESGVRTVEPRKRLWSLTVERWTMWRTERATKQRDNRRAQQDRHHDPPDPSGPPSQGEGVGA